MGSGCNREANKVTAGREDCGIVTTAGAGEQHQQMCSPAAVWQNSSSSEWEWRPPRDPFLLFSSISLGRHETQSLNSVANIF